MVILEDDQSQDTCSQDDFQVETVGAVAAGGVGQACIQLALHRGAEVYATVGSLEKRDLLKARYGIPEDQGQVTPMPGTSVTPRSTRKNARQERKR